MKLVSFSLWGNKAKYNVGAIRNADLVRKYYPRWTARFYVHEATDELIIAELRSAGAQIVLMHGECNWNAALWRFSAVKDDTIETIISRDCDSRISQREVDAVESWLLSPADLHIMRDHPFHSDLILGGMWGAKKALFRSISLDLETFMQSNSKRPEYGIDQEFLRLVYKNHRAQALIHDEFFEGVPWPNSRTEWRFVGQVYDENEKTPLEHIQVLQYTILYRQHMNRFIGLNNTHSIPPRLT
jgi:hypothetical protein